MLLVSILIWTHKRSDEAKAAPKAASQANAGADVLDVLEITWPDGRVYEGAVTDGKMNGSGTCTWPLPDGRVYVGEWKDDKRHGSGRQTWPDGLVYEGNFLDDRISGSGKFTKTLSSLDVHDVYEGKWKDGKPVP